VRPQDVCKDSSRHAQRRRNALVHNADISNDLRRDIVVGFHFESMGWSRVRHPQQRRLRKMEYVTGVAKVYDEAESRNENMNRGED